MNDLKRRTTDSEIGKLPPQVIELEEAVLGAMLLESESVEIVIQILSAESFYKEQNGKVFSAIKRLYKKHEPIDILTVIQELKNKSDLEIAGGAFYVSSLTNRIGSSANIEFHARIVEQKYMQRQVIEISSRLIKLAYEDQTDVFDLITKADNEFINLINKIHRDKIEDIDSIVKKQILEIRESITSGIVPGIKTSITALNNQTGGWQNGDLIILAGRPGMGKTSAALDFALYPSLNGIPAAIFSLEMSKGQLANRVISLISYIPVQKIVTKKLTIHDVDLLDKDGAILNDVPLYIDDTPGLTMLELEAKARKLKREKNIELLVVDYLQLMTGDGGNREQELSKISRGLKRLAKELNIPVIALSQLSRAVESRPDKKPQLSDLRESGAIEQDADMVIFCFRPEYYGFPDYELGGQVYPANQLFIFIISKFRQGLPGEIKAKWIGELTKVDNY